MGVGWCFGRRNAFTSFSPPPILRNLTELLRSSARVVLRSLTWERETRRLVSVCIPLLYERRAFTYKTVLGADDLEPRLPFWPLLFKNATIRLVGSDDLPEEAERRAVEDIETTLADGVLRPRVGMCFPLERIAEAHEAVEGGRARGRVIVEVST
jgi:hypothetical protein